MCRSGYVSIDESHFGSFHNTLVRFRVKEGKGMAYWTSAAALQWIYMRFVYGWVKYIYSSDEQRGDLGLCQTYDASAAIKPVPRPRKKGYADRCGPATSYTYRVIRSSVVLVVEHTVLAYAIEIRTSPAFPARQMAGMRHRLIRRSDPVQLDVPQLRGQRSLYPVSTFVKECCELCLDTNIGLYRVPHAGRHARRPTTGPPRYD